MKIDLSRLFSEPYVPEKNQLGWRAFTKALLNATHNGIFAVDLSGTVVFSNQAIQTAFGLFPGTLLNATLPEFWPEVADTLEDHEYRSGIAVSGKNVSFLARVGPISWKDETIGVLCIFEDVTELEKVTHQMLSFQELSQELDAIIDSSHDGLWICNGDATVIRINSASERINKVRAKDVLGRDMRELVDEGFVDQSVTLRVLETGSRVNILQQTKDGRKLILTGNPVFDSAGRLIRVVVNERDITEIDTLHRELEEQEAIQDRFRHQMLEMQLTELESDKIIARSPCLVKVLQQTLKVSEAESTVLIQGESGAGKGLIADLIHKYSHRAQQPMIKINCGAIPESLVESELFGYEKGAFTGALNKGKPGYFELAHGGILFLDEIGELPLSSQVKLLRFLEDGNIRRIGSTTHRKIDVRIIAATNRALEAMVEEGEFRRDLYYRLNVIPIRVPPLRDRKECILPLIHHYVDHFSTKLGAAKPLSFSREASDALLAYPWPGNVRELMNVCERLVVMAEKNRVDLEDLPGKIAASREAAGLESAIWQEGMTLDQTLQQFEREVLRCAMEKYDTQSEMAKALGVNQSTIARKLVKYGLKS
jgi:PAS domain S-box-containing protein/TyrR family helix-turn-helix protein